MISTKGLQTDNLLLYGAHGPVLVIEVKKAGKVKVEFLSEQSHEHGYYRNTLDISQLDPIPLTPEWLERCGFKKGSSYIGIGYHWDGPNDISIVEQNVDKEDTYRLYGSEWTIGKDFKYLHQLQNLYFALTGEDLQIKLP